MRSVECKAEHLKVGDKFISSVGDKCVVTAIWPKELFPIRASYINNPSAAARGNGISFDMDQSVNLIERDGKEVIGLYKKGVCQQGLCDSIPRTKNIFLYLSAGYYEVDTWLACCASCAPRKEGHWLVPRVSTKEQPTGEWVDLGSLKPGDKFDRYEGCKPKFDPRTVVGREGGQIRLNFDGGVGFSKSNRIVRVIHRADQVARLKKYYSGTGTETATLKRPESLEAIPYSNDSVRRAKEYFMEIMGSQPVVHCMKTETEIVEDSVRGRGTRLINIKRQDMLDWLKAEIKDLPQDLTTNNPDGEICIIVKSDEFDDVGDLKDIVIEKDIKEKLRVKGM
ncbi:MAG: hypothetical protein FVQ84_08355 [Planctomycetes bacterium]|nr:hypothetical protein [Planctomycetota bacterium]